MKYIVLIFGVLMSFTTFAQDDYLVKTDGTKYYLQIYDGETNEKVLYHNSSNDDWKAKVQVADYFDGSNNQLWQFEATEMYPGYFSIVNLDEGITPQHHLMSWNWNAYMTDAENRDPATEKEMQFRFVEAFDGYFILETIEKPTDGSLYGINYTPGADALNVKPNGYASFSEVKSADITRENMANKVFKVIEFNPMALFEESIMRGDDLYRANPNAPAKVRYDFFYTLEKAREIRVFGVEAEMLDFQTSIDAAMADFNAAISFVTVIDDARAFIDGAEVEESVKNSFNAVVEEADALINLDDLDYSQLDGIRGKLNGAQDLVEAIIAAKAYGETLSGQDARLTTGLDVSIANAQEVLANNTSDVSEYSVAITHLTSTQSVLDEIVIANNLIEATQEFEEAKAALEAVIEQTIIIINTEGTLSSALDQAVVDMQGAIKAFKKALEAGDTVIELKNANFDDGSSDWNWDTDTPSSVLPSAKGVDGSKSMTIWNAGAYRMKFFQSISGIPDGVYILSAVIQTNVDSSFELFAESGTNVSETPITLGEGGLEKRQIEITVVEGKMEFGVRGAGENDALGGSNWVVMDDFELKWSSNLPVVNADFDEGVDGYENDGTIGVPYPSAKGVDGSKSVTFWSSSEYVVSFSQELASIPNGTYSVSVSVMTQALDSLFIFYGTDGIDTTKHIISQSTAHSKIKINVPVKNNSLKFGFLGAGENNTVPGGRWLVIDQVEVTRLPEVPIVNAEFNDGKTGWMTDSPTPDAAYPSSKGVDGSKSITCWSGSAYQMKFYQSLSNLLDGTYLLSAFISTNVDGAYELFAESGTNVSELPISKENGLAKRQLEIIVANGDADFGVKGAGENNGLEASSWVVLDDFQIVLKSIIPDYEVVAPAPEIAIAPEPGEMSMQNLEPKVVYMQDYQTLSIRSTVPIIKYSVYNVTGTMIDLKETNSNNLSISLRSGIYVVRVVTESGFVDTEKVSIK